MDHNQPGPPKDSFQKEHVSTHYPQYESKLKKLIVHKRMYTCGRFINSRTAFCGVNSLSIILATAVKTGILTLYFCANAITAPAVDTPSAT